MLHVCCIRAGDHFSPAYVTILADMVRRNLADGFEGKFVCFTDQPDDLGPGIEVRPLPADLPGWWSKLALFRDGLFPDGDKVLFLDLDTLVTGRLDEIANADPGDGLIILRDFYRPDGLQSAIMMWRAGTNTDIWDTYESAGCPQDIPGGDQSMIERIRFSTLGRVGLWQNIFPGLFVSYKQINGPPAKASVVVFHGRPRPHEVIDGWVPQVWKVGGMSRAELDVVCNTAREELLGNVRSSIRLKDVEWFDLAPEHNRHVCIVGGGPSLKEPRVLQELRWRQSQGQRVVALNGSAFFLLMSGIRPDAVVIADARPANAKFLFGLPRTTEAYLASQCHPHTFAMARDRRRVVLWHVNSDGMVDLLKDERERPVHLIGGGSTVGMNAIALFFSEGYRKIHLYGFDSSFDEDHHAYAQTENDADRVLDALYRDRSFKTTAWMAQQVNDFVDLAPGLIADGAIITVAGHGLLPTVAADLFANLPPTPAQQRAAAVLERVNGTEYPVGAEVGVFAGDMSSALLRMHPTLSLTMIDSWEGDGAAYSGDSGDFHAKLPLDAQEGFMRRAIERTEFAAKRRAIVRDRSLHAIPTLGSFDFVFIDADHSYEGCKADIEAWFHKVKPGGWLGGHDYANPDFPKFGVTRAVDEFAAARGLKVELADNFCWFVKVPDSDIKDSDHGS